MLLAGTVGAVVEESQGSKNNTFLEVDFVGGYAKQKSVKKNAMKGRHSVNEGSGKKFYRKGNSLKRPGPFSEPPDCEYCNLLRSSSSQIQSCFNRVSTTRG